MSRLPEPVVSVHIHPASKQSEEKLASALRTLAETDKIFRVETDRRTGHISLQGVGELHLDALLYRLRGELGVKLETSKPRVLYRETILESVVQEAKIVKQSRYAAHLGHCVLSIEPLSPGDGFEFVSKAKPAQIPAEFIASVEEGVREASERGPLTGHPLVDLRVAVTGGSFHAASSNDSAFSAAGYVAMRLGCKKAHPILLEPIMKIEVAAPSFFADDVIGDLQSRRGKVQDVVERDRTKTVRAQVPLGEMFGYADFARGLTQSRCSFTMEFDHFAQMPLSLYRAAIDPHGPEDPPTAGAGRAVKPTRPRPGLAPAAKHTLPEDE